MYTLGTKDQKEYTNVLTNVIPNLKKKPGIYFPTDFFPNNGSNPRVMRKLRTEVEAGLVEGVTLAKQRSRDGYIVA